MTLQWRGEPFESLRVDAISSSALEIIVLSRYVQEIASVHVAPISLALPADLCGLARDILVNDDVDVVPEGAILPATSHVVRLSELPDIFEERKWKTPDDPPAVRELGRPRRIPVRVALINCAEAELFDELASLLPRVTLSEHSCGFTSEGYTEIINASDESDVVVTTAPLVAAVVGQLGQPAWLLSPLPDSGLFPSVRVFNRPSLGYAATVVAELREVTR